MKKGMKVYTENGSVAASFHSVKRVGDKLIVDGKALDTMRMDMIFTLEETLSGLKMALCWGVISYFLLLPYFIFRRRFFRGSAVG